MLWFCKRSVRILGPLFGGFVLYLLFKEFEISAEDFISPICTYKINEQNYPSPQKKFYNVLLLSLDFLFIIPVAFSESLPYYLQNNQNGLGVKKKAAFL